MQNVLDELKDPIELRTNKPLMHIIFFYCSLAQMNEDVIMFTCPARNEHLMLFIFYGHLCFCCFIFIFMWLGPRNFNLVALYCHMFIFCALSPACTDIDFGLVFHPD